MLEQNPKIHVFTTGIQYKHYEDLEKLWDHSHRNDNAAAWWVDVISENEKFTCKQLAKHCKFFYFLTEPDYALSRIEYSPVNAAAYYRFRLRGLAQWWMRTGGPWVDCDRDFADPELVQNAVETFLPELVFDYYTEGQAKPEPPQFEFADGIAPSIKKECQDAFVRYKRIIQGRPLPTDGDSHLLSMQAAERSP